MGLDDSLLVFNPICAGEEESPMFPVPDLDDRTMWAGLGAFFGGFLVGLRKRLPGYRQHDRLEHMEELLEKMHLWIVKLEGLIQGRR